MEGYNDAQGKRSVFPLPYPMIHPDDSIHPEVSYHEVNLGLQEFGVIPFEIRTLWKGHTEKWRTRRIVYNKAIVDTEAPLARGETEEMCELY